MSTTSSAEEKMIACNGSRKCHDTFSPSKCSTPSATRRGKSFRLSQSSASGNLRLTSSTNWNEEYPGLEAGILKDLQAEQAVLADLEHRAEVARAGRLPLVGEVLLHLVDLAGRRCHKA